jgi:hypothetical protein
MQKFTVEISKGRFKIYGLVHEVGPDILVSIWGGTRPHIGAIGMAIPRRSLKNARQWSATSSNFTFEGHKEDLLVKKVSEKLATRMRRNGRMCGVHWDGITAKRFNGSKSHPENIGRHLRKFLLFLGKRKMKAEAQACGNCFVRPSGGKNGRSSGGRSNRNCS